METLRDPSLRREYVRKAQREKVGWRDLRCTIKTYPAEWREQGCWRLRVAGGKGKGRGRGIGDLPAEIRSWSRTI